MTQASLLAQRYSARGYDGSPILPESLRSLLEAARWAPSSFNEQPWFFLVAPRQNQAEFQKMLGCLAEPNQAWAKDAGALMACVASREVTSRQIPNRHAWHDMGQAVMAMSIQAVSLGLQMRVMGGVDRDKIRQLYKVPETHDITAGLAVGVPKDHAEYKTQRARKPLQSFVFEGAWGKQADFLEAEAHGGRKPA